MAVYHILLFCKKSLRLNVRSINKKNICLTSPQLNLESTIAQKFNLLVPAGELTFDICLHDFVGL
jgi:hypothetical protein